VPAADKPGNSLQKLKVMPEPICLKSPESP